MDIETNLQDRVVRNRVPHSIGVVLLGELSGQYGVLVTARVGADAIRYYKLPTVRVQDVRIDEGTTEEEQVEKKSELKRKIFMLNKKYESEFNRNVAF